MPTKSPSTLKPSHLTVRAVRPNRWSVRRKALEIARVERLPSGDVSLEFVGDYRIDDAEGRAIASFCICNVT